MSTNNNEVEISNYYYKKNEVYQKSEVDDLLDSVSSDIVVLDRLDSNSTVDALSANQGKILKEMIDSDEEEMLEHQLDILRIKSKQSQQDNKLDQLDTNKVDKVDGKDLSTNDFTDAYKQQLDDLAANPSNIVVVDNLTSTSTTDALSANQGRVLKDSIDALPVIASVNSLSNLPSSSNPEVIDYTGKICYVESEGKFYTPETEVVEEHDVSSGNSSGATYYYTWKPLGGDVSSSYVAMSVTYTDGTQETINILTKEDEE